MRRSAAILVVPVVAALLLTLFAWPASRLEPRDLRVGATGPAAAAVEQRLPEDAFEVHRYADAASARRAVEDRAVHGALVATTDGPEVLVASAGGPSVAALVEDALRPAAPHARVHDLVPAPAADPRGTGLAAAILPLAIAGVMTGVAATLAPAGPRGAALVAAGSVAVALAATAVVDSWLGVLAGGWAANWAAISLVVLAIASAVSGLGSLLGRAGIAVAGATVVLAGNALSAVTSDPELLPRPLGAIGQLLPPGAGAGLLRSTAFFDGAAAGGHVVVLAAWAFAGAALLFASPTIPNRKDTP